MSNIFEIDGEIEDNDDDGNNGEGKQEEGLNDEENQENTSEESTESDDSEEGTSIVFGEAEDEQGQNEEASDSEAEDEVPWYDKVLSDDTEESSSVEEEQPLPTAVVDESGTDDGVSVEDDSQEEEEPVDDAEFDEEPYRPEDVTQEEIDEVLAEVDQSEKELREEKYRFEEDNEPANEVEEEEAADEEEEREESFDEIFPRSNGNKSRKPLSMGTLIFATLFLISLTLLGYYQFYDGEHFSVNFHHRSGGAVAQLDSLAEVNKKSTEEINDLVAKIELLTKEVRERTAAYEELKNDTNRTFAIDQQGDDDPRTLKVDFSDGTYYQVQLIALRQYNPDFGKSDFSFYVDKEDGFSKMLIGAFASEDQAKALFEKVKLSGFSDAFIVKKVDGERVEYNPFE